MDPHQIACAVTIHGDILGSTDAISSESGAFVRQGWEAFGGWDTERSDPPMSGLESRLGFTGHMDDHGTGLINMKGRLYDPLVGRFMTPDPVVQAPFWSRGHNQYSYVFNDPVSLVDPSGFSTDRNLAMGMGQWAGTVAIATAASAAFQSGGFGFLTDGLGASAGSAAGRGLGNAIAGALGAGPGDVSVSMPSSVAKGTGKAPNGGATGQNRGGVGGRTLSQSQGHDPSVPVPTPGTIDPDEPIADPGVQRELRRAWDESNPSSNPGSRTKEQGGWIIERSDPKEIAELGEHYVIRWPAAQAVSEHIPIPAYPQGVKVTGSFHTHPCLGPKWYPGPSGRDWRAFSVMSEPHYVVDEDGVYRIAGDKNEYIGDPLSPSWPWYIAVGAGAAGGVWAAYAYL